MGVDWVSPAAAAILEHPDFLGFLLRVGVDDVLVEELAIDLPGAIAAFEPECTGLSLRRLRQ